MYTDPASRGAQHVYSRSASGTKGKETAAGGIVKKVLRAGATRRGEKFKSGSKSPNGRMDTKMKTIFSRSFGKS